MHAQENLAAPRLSIGVATYKRPEGLRRLLDALRPQIEGHPTRKVVVVNDGSHDSAYAAVAAAFADVVTYHPLAHHDSIASTRNAIAARMCGDYIVFIDDDCVPPTWWLDWLEARLDANPELELVIGTTRPRLPERPRFMEKVNAHFDIIPLPHGSPSVPLFVTANVAIRRSLFEQVGGFGLTDSKWAAGEDTELASRLAAAGARTVVDKNWFVEHDVSDGLRRQMRRFWRYGYANVQMSAMTTAPDQNAGLTRADRRYLLSQAIEQFRENLVLSEGFSNLPPVRWCSAALASAVRVSFYAGCAAAAADRRRALRI